MLATLQNEEVREERWLEVASLVERAQDGDREAMGQLVEQFQKTVYAICLSRLGNPSEALELTQEVFLHVLRRIDQLREPERFAGWLRQVAVRMAINRATRRLPLPNVESEVLEAASSTQGNGASGSNGRDPLQELIRRERAHRLWDGLARLKPLDREALVAFYIHGRSLAEIAEDLDVPIGTVKRRLHVARHRLKDVLQASAGDADEWTDGARAEDVEEEALAGVF